MAHDFPSTLIIDLGRAELRGSVTPITFWSFLAQADFEGAVIRFETARGKITSVMAITPEIMRAAQRLIHN